MKQLPDSQSNCIESPASVRDGGSIAAAVQCIAKREGLYSSRVSTPRMSRGLARLGPRWKCDWIFAPTGRHSTGSTHRVLEVIFYGGSQFLSTLVLFRAFPIWVSTGKTASASAPAEARQPVPRYVRQRSQVVDTRVMPTAARQCPVSHAQCAEHRGDSTCDGAHQRVSTGSGFLRACRCYAASPDVTS